MNQMLRPLETTLLEGLSSSRERTDAGGFAILWTPEDPTTWMNYAIPLEAYDVPLLIKGFDQIRRQPRIEYLCELHPNLQPLLIEAGFVVELEAPVMTLSRERFRPAEHPYVVSAQPNDAVNLDSVTSVAFGMPSTEHQVKMTAKSIESGRSLAALAWSDGLPVSAGFAVGNRKVREIAGVATLPDYRRRGLAGAVINQLLGRFFDDGGEVAWLTPGDEGAQRLYANLGFEISGTQINLVLPEP